MDSDDFVVAMAAVKVHVERARRSLAAPGGLELVKLVLVKIAQLGNSVAELLIAEVQPDKATWTSPELLTEVCELAASLDEIVARLSKMKSLDAGDVEILTGALEEISKGAGELMEKATKPERVLRP